MCQHAVLWYNTKTNIIGHFRKKMFFFFKKKHFNFYFGKYIYLFGSILFANLLANSERCLFLSLEMVNGNIFYYDCFNEFCYLWPILIIACFIFEEIYKHVKGNVHVS